LLKDSRASFTIENENPGTIEPWWGIGQAGGAALSLEELERLQQIVMKIADLRKWDCARKQALLENTTELQEHLFQIIFRQQQRY
jgi:hypothetical protein